MAKKIDYASLYTLKSDGRYQGYYRDENGKRHAVCDKDPKKLYFKIQEKLEPKEKPPILFKEIAEAWYNEAWDKIEDGTQSSYKAPYERAVERFGDHVAVDITSRDIMAHLAFLKDMGRARNTVKIQKIIYSLIYQAAIINPKYENEIKSNPAEYAKMPTGFRPASERMAPEDDIVKQIQQKAETAYFGTFPLFLLCTGFRRGEALAVKWENIDFKNERIYCKTQITARSGTSKEKDTKTKQGVRDVPLLAPLKAVLHKPENAKDTDYVFYGSDPSKPMPQSTYDRKWMHYCKDMGFVRITKEEKRESVQGKKYTVYEYAPTLTAHTLRHGYVTMLFEAGVDEYTAKKLAGHADIATTRAIYTHLRNKKENESETKLKEHAKNGL